MIKLEQSALRASFVLAILQLMSCQNSDFYEKQMQASATVPDPGTDTFPGPGNNGGGNGGSGNNGGGSGNENSPTPVPTATAKVYQDMADHFTQNNKEYGHVDILWMVDNSGSMADEQSSLANNFGIFIDRFKDEDIDFKMAIITTDPRAQYAGVPVAGSMNLLTYAQAQADEAAFINNFKTMIQVGTHGSGSEQGLYTSKKFFENNSSWLRSDAYLAVIYVSDEEDQSPNTVSHYVDYLKGLKTNPDKVKAHVIVDKDGTQHNGSTTGSLRYQAAANATNGSINEITSNFGTSLDDIAEQIVQLTLSFTLSSQAIADSIKVYVNNVENFDWSYDSNTNSIQFDPNHVPASGADIDVQYQTE